MNIGWSYNFFQAFLPKSEHNAVAEAHRLNIPVFALVDTNCDPEEVDYVIPANDDAIRSVKLVVATMANAVVEAQGGTPIVVEFTDEPIPEERPSRRPNRGNGRDHNRQRREFRPREPRNEAKKEQKAPEAKAEVKAEAPAAE